MYHAAGAAIRKPAIVPTLAAVTVSHTYPTGGPPPVPGLDVLGEGLGDGLGLVDGLCDVVGDVEGLPEDECLPDGLAEGLPDGLALPDGDGWPGPCEPGGWPPEPECLPTV